MLTKDFDLLTDEKFDELWFEIILNELALDGDKAVIEK